MEEMVNYTVRTRIKVIHNHPFLDFEKDFEIQIPLTKVEEHEKNEKLGRVDPGMGAPLQFRIRYQIHKQLEEKTADPDIAMIGDRIFFTEILDYSEKKEIPDSKVKFRPGR